jgi:hypothetical protein
VTQHPAATPERGNDRHRLTIDGLPWPTYLWLAIQAVAFGAGMGLAYRYVDRWLTWLFS